MGRSGVVFSARARRTEFCRAVPAVSAAAVFHGICHRLGARPVGAVPQLPVGDCRARPDCRGVDRVCPAHYLCAGRHFDGAIFGVGAGAHPVAARWLYRLGRCGGKNRPASAAQRRWALAALSQSGRLPRRFRLTDRGAQGAEHRPCAGRRERLRLVQYGPSGTAREKARRGFKLVFPRPSQRLWHGAAVLPPRRVAVCAGPMGAGLPKSVARTGHAPHGARPEQISHFARRSGTGAAAVRRGTRRLPSPAERQP